MKAPRPEDLLLNAEELAEAQRRFPHAPGVFVWWDGEKRIIAPAPGDLNLRPDRPTTSWAPRLPRLAVIPAPPLPVDPEVALRRKRREPAADGPRPIEPPRQRCPVCGEWSYIRWHRVRCEGCDALLPDRRVRLRAQSLPRALRAQVWRKHCELCGLPIQPGEGHCVLNSRRTGEPAYYVHNVCPEDLMLPRRHCDD